jgi:hypothetical protein
MNSSLARHAATLDRSVFSPAEDCRMLVSFSDSLEAEAWGVWSA